MTKTGTRKKKSSRKRTFKKAEHEMNAALLGSVYVTLHELISELYNNDTITERQHDRLCDLISGGKKAIAKSKRSGGKT